MQAVILLGGKGTRLKGVLGDVPKALVEIHGKPLLGYLFSLLREHNVRDVVLCTGHGAEKIHAWAGDGRRFGLRLRYSHESIPLGTAGALRNIPFPLQESFFVLYGDVLVWMDLQRLLRFHSEKGSESTLVVHPSDHPYDSDLVEIDETGRITRFLGRPNPGDTFTNLTSAALYVMCASCLAHIPPGRNLDLARDIFPGMLRAGHVLFGYATDEYLKDVGTPERLAQVHRHILEGRVPAPCRAP
jgi:mannose-1-phosphate guanylyltransferase / phosphomannomutase